MKFPRVLLIVSISFLLSPSTLLAQQVKDVKIIASTKSAPRVRFGADHLANVFQQQHINTIAADTRSTTKGYRVVLGKTNDPGISKYITERDSIGKEGFAIFSNGSHEIIVAGSDESGILYGCLALGDQINAAGGWPKNISLRDQPQMVLRGACIGVQKPYYLPGRTVYEYPYTPETFPWFYDKQLWIQYLDSMVTNRMNSLYLWNGHPFASLVRLKEYPYAVEVDDATFKKNEEIFKFLTTEADKRGIWVIQMFYNIIVSKPFAAKHNIKTQDRERPIIPLIADYTRKSIAAFVEKYPNVGLMVCLGEAMEGTGHDDVEWFTKTIIPGVQDGLKALGKTAEPPIVLRAHDTDAPMVMKAALPLYKNLYTEAKFNGEALTTYEPRGKWAELHQTLSRIGTVQIENVHILANLEPFRYGATDFIRRSVRGMRSIMEGNGLHLYPQASYWDWPYTAASVKGRRLLQVERDWIWYAAWSRYAWNSDRTEKDEKEYWSHLLALKFGCSDEKGEQVLNAYEQSGLIAPKLLRRFGITDGNRQTMTLGMLMPQLINPFRFGLFTLLYESESPEGEMLIDYALKEWNKQPHIGETPLQIIREVREHGKNAVAAIESARSSVTTNHAEFERLLNDMHCYQALAEHYASKCEAALLVLRYKYSKDVTDLEKALPLLAQSVVHYRKLVDLTKGNYLYANSMQTQQRKIPIRGVDGTFKTWAEVLVPFEKELKRFTYAIDSIKNDKGAGATTVVRLRSEPVRLISPRERRFTIATNKKVFTDTNLVIRAYANELDSLEGISFSMKQQLASGTSVTFYTPVPVRLLVGFFNVPGPQFLKAPELETNASANERGQAETIIANGLLIDGLPPVNVHSYSFGAGEHTLQLAKGACLVLGFVSGDATIKVYDAGITVKGITKEIDWLFE